MKKSIVARSGMVLLLGGAGCDKTAFDTLLVKSDAVVAADGGADHALALGCVPDAVIGDLDSVSDQALVKIPSERVHHIAEQDSTDFDKVLRSVDAPLVVGLGFLGGRIDHELAVLNVLVRRPDRLCVMVGDEDVICHVPPELALDLPLESRFSLFPMAPVTGRSEGLRWPIDGIGFAPDGRGGTSNAVSGPVRLQMDGPGMLLILPRSALEPVLGALSTVSGLWPSRDT